MAAGSPELLAPKPRPSGRFWRGLSLVTVLLGIICPGLAVLKGPHVPLVMLLIAVLPLIWIVRWRTVGFLFGVPFLWLCSYAFGLSTLGPGQVDNMVPALTLVCGGVFAMLYLGPVLLVTLAVAGLRTRREQSAPGDGPSPETAGLPEPRGWIGPPVGGFIALLCAVGMLHLCWTFRPRHPQHVAIEAIEKTGARVELNPLAPGEPVDSVRARGGSLGDAEMSYIAQFEQLKELDLASTGVTDAGLKHLDGLANLCELDLRGTQVTDEGVRAFKEQHPNTHVNHGPL